MRGYSKKVTKIVKPNFIIRLVEDGKIVDTYNNNDEFEKAIYILERFVEMSNEGRNVRLVIRSENMVNYFSVIFDNNTKIIEAKIAKQ